MRVRSSLLTLLTSCALISICWVHRSSVKAAKQDLPPILESQALPKVEWEKFRVEETAASDSRPSLTAWLWWPFGLYLFWAQATVCDEFFVPSVQTCSEILKIPDDVAGATLMALGCNGPELAVNVIAIFITHSQVGVGTIVGSDVFNLLVIAGAATLAAPTSPVQLDASRVFRDVLFYTISIVLLVFVISDGKVEAWQGLMLSLMVCVYAIAVAFWSRLDSLCSRRRSRSVARSSDMTPDPQGLHSLPERPSGSSSAGGAETGGAGMEAHPNRSQPELAAAGLALLERGTAVRVRRAGRKGRFETRLAAIAGNTGFGAKRFARLDKHQGVLHMNLDTAELLPGDFQRHHEMAHECLMIGDLSGISQIHMKDILRCECGEGLTFTLQYIDPEIEWIGPVVNPARGVTLEFEVSTEFERDLCVAVLGDESVITQPNREEFVQLVEEHRHAVDAWDPHNRTCKQHLVSLVRWFCFPVLLALEITVPKCFSNATRRMWPFTFLMSMVWLSFFSYWICVMADELSEAPPRGFGIPPPLLGLTLTSIGTSFPNCIASVIVARQGQCSMAIANALGSNIQNVFLALGFPWLVNALIHGGEFPQSTEGIYAGVVSMAGSLVLFVAFLALNQCRMGRYASIVFLFAYVTFFATTILTTYNVL